MPKPKPTPATAPADPQRAWREKWKALVGEVSPTDFDRTIDTGRLDYEWQRQADMYHNAAIYAADMKKAAKDAEAELKIAEADAKLAVRQNPAAYGIEKAKATEDEVKSTFVKHPAYRAALRKLIDAEHDADVAAAACRTLDQKKHALQDLTSLQGRDYFAAPAARDEDAKRAIVRAQDNGRKGGIPVPTEWD